MKPVIAAIAAALVSAASVGGMTTFKGLENERELAVELPVDAIAAQELVPFIEKAAREQGIQKVRAYKTDVFIPLEEAQLSFVREGGHLNLHVAVESQYRFQKGERAAVLENLKHKGHEIFTRALILKGQSQAG